LLHILGVLAVNGAAGGFRGTENFLDGALKLARAGAGAHDARDFDAVVERDVAGVLHVLHLLAVAGGLLERLDDERGRGGHHGHLRLTVLHGELDGDAKAVPVLLGLLRDVFADLLGGQTERTDLRRERRGSADLATGGAEEHLDDG